jgi:hypothetical protein
VFALESSGLATQVQVINQAGRMRWLSQRMAKLALLRVSAADAASIDAAMMQTAREVDDGLALLGQAPLSTPEIRILLGRGEQTWRQLRDAVPGAGQAGGRMKLAAASEELLELFDRLTAAYQHSLQVLLG